MRRTCYRVLLALASLLMVLGGGALAEPPAKRLESDSSATHFIGFLLPMPLEASKERQPPAAELRAITTEVHWVATWAKENKEYHRAGVFLYQGAPSLKWQDGPQSLTISATAKRANVAYQWRF